jgi:tRNA (pseudouridine54-N1)-methyltransferase
MRHFIYFSKSARTSGNFQEDDLMKAGRMDIAIHSVISSFFLSHSYRDDVRLHLVFYGPPDPPKHIEIRVTPELEMNKKNVARLIKKILYKYKEGQKAEPLPGCFVEKKSLIKVVESLLEDKEGKKVFILDKRGEALRDVSIDENSEPAFLIGDHDGLPKKEFRRLKDLATPVNVGPKMYFASQVITIVNNELDVRGV